MISHRLMRREPTRPEENVPLRHGQLAYNPENQLKILYFIKS
jgi:hypothetical protein